MGNGEWGMGNGEVWKIESLLYPLRLGPLVRFDVHIQHTSTLSVFWLRQTTIPRERPEPCHISTPIPTHLLFEAAIEYSCTQSQS